jgi:hypothetical protein
VRLYVVADQTFGQFDRPPPKFYSLADIASCHCEARTRAVTHRKVSRGWKRLQQRDRIVNLAIREPAVARFPVLIAQQQQHPAL